MNEKQQFPAPPVAQAALSMENSDLRQEMSRRDNPGWPKWTRIAIPAVVLIVGGIIAVNQKFVDGQTRTGVDAFNNLYSDKLTNAVIDEPSRKGLQDAAAKYGPPDKYQVSESKDRESSPRIHDVVGYVRRRGLWHRESFTFTTRRRGTDVLSNFQCQPLNLNDAKFEAAHHQPKS